jgi:addiction module RelE/StbE family toxin
VAHQLIWSTRAKAEIHEIAKYIERDSMANADTMVGKIIEAVRRLAELPLSGRVVPEWEIAAYRELIVYPYRVVYRVSNETVGIALIRHSRRAFPKRPPRVRF